MDKIVIFGAGGHAKVVVDVVERQGRYVIEAIFDDDKTKHVLLGYPVVHELEKVRQSGVTQGIIAIGNNWTRSAMVGRIRNMIPDFAFITAVHPFTSLGRNVRIGEGTVVMAGCCINPDTLIGKHCIVNTRASLDHENVVNDFANVSPGATTGGKVTLGEYCFIGLGAAIIQKVTVGAHSIVGAGAVVVKSVPEKVLAFGNPCRTIRPIDIGEKLV
jgi:sugar O-acyltransferase (sialic acid O-acetyltransferase NeuD family)